MKTITHFQVGNGHCSLIEDTNFVMIIDLNKTEDKESSYELLKPFFKKLNGKDCIDILCITQNDKDHCFGFSKFKEEMDKGNLIIGSIWHQDYDRTKILKKEELPTDYLELKKEIERREKIKNPTFGDMVKTPKAKDIDGALFDNIPNKPKALSVKILGPFAGDNEDTPGYDHNDLSIVLNVTFDGIVKLYTADSSGKYWQKRIMPDLLNKTAYADWARADILIGAHHGSFSFFGEDRKEVRDAETEPENYAALDKISADDLIISACSKFPLDGDASGDQPPHYAAWKWYHKWYVDNKKVDAEDKHPECFRYTVDGNVRLEYNFTTRSWDWNNGWNHNLKKKEEVKNTTRQETKFA